jgi:hypothetical protein
MKNKIITSTFIIITMIYSKKENTNWLYCSICNILSSTSLKCDLCQSITYCSVECQEKNYLSHLHSCKKEIYHPEKDIIEWFTSFEQLTYVMQSLLFTLKNTNLTLGCAITSMGNCEFHCKKSGVFGLECDCAGYLCQIKAVNKEDIHRVILQYKLLGAKVEDFGVPSDKRKKEVIYSYLVNDKLAALAVKYINASNNSYILGSLTALDSSKLIYPINIYINREQGEKKAKLSISKVGQLS